MRILASSIAVFWSLKGHAMQFHADIHVAPGEGAREAVRRFREMFPTDVVRSARDRSGRFQSFASREA